jgi:hypothetical protein
VKYEILAADLFDGGMIDICQKKVGAELRVQSFQMFLYGNFLYGI